MLKPETLFSRSKVKNSVNFYMGDNVPKLGEERGAMSFLKDSILKANEKNNNVKVGASIFKDDEKDYFIILICSVDNQKTLELVAKRKTAKYRNIEEKYNGFFWVISSKKIFGKNDAEKYESLRKMISQLVG